MNLLESYAKRLSVAESVYSDRNSGAKLSNTKKIALATVLNNTEKFLNEAFTNSVGTQRADMGAFKRFCLNLTTVTMPNLIASELVIVHPMTSMAGYISYLKFVKGTNKGESKRGDLVADPFKLGNVDVNYTSSLVVENVKANKANETIQLAWFPVFEGTDEFGRDFGPSVVSPTEAKIKVEDAKAGIISISGVPEGTEVKIRYAYDNVVIPQNDLPILNAEMANIALVAKARRIAVYYSQLAAFQAKQDYGFDLGDQLAEKAVAELSYEIDTEITQLLIDNAAEDAKLTWNKALPVGVSKADHYAGFAETIADAGRIIYDRTKKHMPTYMLVASDIVPVLKFVPGFSAAPINSVNGPYYLGTVDGLKVFVTPNIAAGRFVVGVNGNDMMTSAAVYAPYMAIVPTQLLQYADGGTSQGFSTLYDLKLLNEALLVSGEVVNKPEEVIVNNKVISG